MLKEIENTSTFLGSLWGLLIFGYMFVNWKKDEWFMHIWNETGPHGTPDMTLLVDSLFLCQSLLFTSFSRSHQVTNKGRTWPCPLETMGPICGARVWSQFNRPRYVEPKLHFVSTILPWCGGVTLWRGA